MSKLVNPIFLQEVIEDFCLPSSIRPLLLPGDESKADELIQDLQKSCSDGFVLCVEESDHSHSRFQQKYPEAILLVQDQARFLAIFRRRRFHLENVDGPVSNFDCRINFVEGDRQTVEQRLYSILHPETENAWKLTFCNAFYPFPIRYLTVDETKEVNSKNDGREVFFSELNLLHRDPCLPELRPYIGYYHDHYSTDMDLTLRHGFHAIASPYPATIHRLVDHPHIFALPNVMVPELLTRADKKNDRILVTGSATASPFHYPDRIKLYEKIRRYPDYAQALRIDTSARDGNGEAMRGQLNFRRFNSLQSGYRAVVFAGNRWGYFFRKYFEVLGARLGEHIPPPLLIAPKTPETEYFGLKPREHFIELERDSFFEQIGDVQARPEFYEKIAWAGYAWYRNFLKTYYQTYLPEQIKTIQRKKSESYPPGQIRSECHWEMHFDRGIFHFLLRNLKMGLRYLTEAYRLNPQHLETLEYIVQAKIDLGQYEEAWKILRESPPTANMVKNKALLLMREKKFLDAIHVLREYIVKENGDPIALRNLACCFLHVGKFQEAIDLYLEAIDADIDENTQMESRCDLAVAFAALGDVAQARDFLEQVIAKIPDHPRAKTILDQMSVGARKSQNPAGPSSSL